MADVTATATPLVRLDRVRKEFGAVVALEEVSLDVNAGRSSRWSATTARASRRS
jgi:ABC-type sugar transport system ATPase subunit